jgi:hypothetical protein
LYSFYKPNDYAKGNMLAINPLWYKAYNEKQILLRDFKEDSYFYMDFEVLKIFNQYGEEKFYNDPIWKFDWEACRLEALKLKIAGIPNKKIKRPLFLQIFVVDLIFDVMNKITAFKKKIT